MVRGAGGGGGEEPRNEMIETKMRNERRDKKK